MDTMGTDERRRRRWYSAEEKARIVAESCEPGVSVSQVARRHDINANLVFTWRRQTRRPATSSSDRTGLIPVELFEEVGAASPAVPSASADIPPMDLIEIVLVDGVRLRLGAGFDATALERVLSVLRAAA